MSTYRFIFTCILIFSTSLINTSASWANSEVDKVLLNKISTAQQTLADTEQRVAEQRSTLATKLNTLEQEIVQLRAQTAAARRLSDEKTLSLSQLEARLKQWRDQHVYQKHMIQRFIQQHTLEKSTSALSTGQQMPLILNYARQLQQELRPSWKKANVFMPSGKAQNLDTLTIGPIHWYWVDSAQQAGLANRQDGQLHSAMLLSANQSQGLASLKQQNVGGLTFDPTMDRALARQQHNETPWQHLLKGGVWVIPIVVFALLALSIALFKSWQLLSLPRIIRFTPSNIHNLLTQTDSPLLNTVKGRQANLVKIAKQTQSEQARDDQLFVQLQQDKHSLERWLMVIGMTASVAPLLGLLGTVSGMIETFKMMTLFGSGDPEVVSGGIAQALITTELGLVVAIPALVLNAILSKNVKSYYQELENFAILLSQPQSDNQANLQQVAA